MWTFTVNNTSSILSEGIMGEAGLRLVDEVYEG